MIIVIDRYALGLLAYSCIPITPVIKKRRKLKYNVRIFQRTLKLEYDAVRTYLSKNKIRTLCIFEPWTTHINQPLH